MFLYSFCYKRKIYLNLMKRMPCCCECGMWKIATTRNPLNVSNFLKCVSHWRCCSCSLCVACLLEADQTCIRINLVLCETWFGTTMNNNDERFRNHFVFRQHQLRVFICENFHRQKCFRFFFAILMSDNAETLNVSRVAKSFNAEISTFINIALFAAASAFASAFSKIN